MCILFLLSSGIIFIAYLPFISLFTKYIYIPNKFSKWKNITFSIVYFIKVLRISRYEIITHIIYIFDIYQQKPVNFSHKVEKPFYSIPETSLYEGNANSKHFIFYITYIEHKLYNGEFYFIWYRNLIIFTTIINLTAKILVSRLFCASTKPSFPRKGLWNSKSETSNRFYRSLFIIV